MAAYDWPSTSGSFLVGSLRWVQATVRICPRSYLMIRSREAACKIEERHLWVLTIGVASEAHAGGAACSTPEGVGLGYIVVYSRAI